jgi:hypothetical protein
MSSLQQNWRRGQNKFCLEVRRVAWKGRGWRQGGEMAQKIYAHMNKGINNKKYSFSSSMLFARCAVFLHTTAFPCFRSRGLLVSCCSKVTKPVSKFSLVPLSLCLEPASGFLSANFVFLTFSTNREQNL